MKIEKKFGLKTLIFADIKQFKIEKVAYLFETY